MDEPAARTQVSLRVPTEVVEGFDTIARALERDRSWVMLRALKQYLENEGADLMAELEGLAAAERGDLLDFDAVMAEAEEIIRQAERRQKHKAG